jgi:hypothetical protein
VHRDPSTKARAVAVFSNLMSAEEDELTAYWLRSHIFAHRLFGNPTGRDNTSFLDKDQTLAMARQKSIAWRAIHMAGKLIPCRWDLQPVYTMIDMGVWDDQCRQLVDTALADNRAVDGLTLMLYGSYYTTGEDTIAKLCSYDLYAKRATERLEASADPPHESVLVALRKAVGRR